MPSRVECRRRVPSILASSGVRPGREEYTANVIGPIKLFEELIRLRLGRVEQYDRARQLAWDWLLEYPMKNGAWSGYFEDVYQVSDPWQNITQYIPLETARYMMDHPERDPDWATHVPALIAWVEEHFAQDTPGTFDELGVQWGAITISEQIADMGKMGSHTARYASINAQWHELTGDMQAREKAYRSFNWATYLSDEKGAVSAGVDFTVDEDSSEVLRVNTRPTSVRAGNQALEERDALTSEGYTLQSLPGGDFVLRIRHQHARDIQARITAAGARRERA